MSFDDELRRAFERREPPPGFADRVLARIDEASSADAPRSPIKVSSPPAVRWIVAMAACAVLAIASTQYYAARQAAAREAMVKEQLRASLLIASEKLNDVERKLWEHNQRDF